MSFNNSCHKSLRLQTSFGRRPEERAEREREREDKDEERNSLRNDKDDKLSERRVQDGKFKMAAMLIILD